MSFDVFIDVLSVNVGDAVERTADQVLSDCVF